MHFILAFSLFFVAVAQASPLKVAVTHPFYAEWVESVGGDVVEAIVVTEDRSGALADVAIVYETGLGQQPWLDDAIKQSGAEPRRVVLTDGMKTMNKGEPYWQSMPLPHPNPEKMPECCRKDAADTNAAWEKLVEGVPHQTPDNHGIDPNVWYNPLNAQSAVLIISDTLYETLPDHADAIDRKTTQALEKLQGLDGWIKSRIRNIPMLSRILVTDGDSFRYFAREYGLIAPNAELSDTPIIPEYKSDPTVGNQSDPYLFLHTNYPRDSKHPGTYNELMRRNTAVITEALSEAPKPTPAGS